MACHRGAYEDEARDVLNQALGGLRMELPLRRGPAR
jgi:plasmid stability protein